MFEGNLSVPRTEQSARSKSIAEEGKTRLNALTIKYS